ncbi:hypothetical protein FHT08_003288 [Xanthomonas campestris]|uniref:DUF3800 domain-containing protein n=1 Tax=Xanthomonas sp. CFBP 8151 TaxID=3035310 RepID=UPI00141AFF2B|nr:DUF3800 domain-containing protein [Xanthomonas sp. CFBP 8151]NIJ78168.1 hypothetical protein [Xanthomonas sp. CFBP 8151]
MFIYVDESGSFVPATRSDSWCVVAGYVVPEVARRRVECSLSLLKRRIGCGYQDELKLRHLSESQLKRFLGELGDLDAALFISAIDLGHQDAQAVLIHQRKQVESVRANRPNMLYEEGRASIDDLSGRLERLSPQLYTQMVAQIDLLDQVFRMATLYYAQRVPATLGSFKWRMDEKNSARPLFEQTLSHMAPALIQAKSLRDPGIFVEGFDYSHFEKRFRNAPEDIPTYLQEAAGHTIKSAVNLGAILRDSQFVRSHDVPGVQVADLLASAWRRVLRGAFEDNDRIAFLLGRLTVQGQTPNPSIHLMSLGDERLAEGGVYRAVLIAKKSARAMFRER